MEYKTEIKYLRISSRKLREVVNMIKNKSISDVLTQLEFINKKGAVLLLSAFKSAIADAQNNKNAKADKLILKNLQIDKGPDLKRWRPASRGMAHPYKKRTSHIKLVLTDELNPKQI